MLMERENNMAGHIHILIISVCSLKKFNRIAFANEHIDRI